MKKYLKVLFSFLCILVIPYEFVYSQTSNSIIKDTKSLGFNLQYAHAGHASDYQIFPSFYSGWDLEDSLQCLGASHALHPSVLYISDGLWGFKYWMAYTPICISESDENPHIAVSNNGIDWEEFTNGVDTLYNPLYNLKDFKALHLSDPDILYDYNNKLLQVFRVSWNVAGKDSNAIYITHTNNGIDWDPPIKILSDSILQQENISAFISPSLIISNDSLYSLYIVEPFAAGQTYLDSSRVVRYVISPVDYSILAFDTCQFPSSDDTMKIWHLEIVNMNDSLLGLVTESPNHRLNGGDSTELYLALSVDNGQSWTINQNPVLSWTNDINAWDGRMIYRSSGYWIENIDRKVLGLYYSANSYGVSQGGSGSGWQTGFTYVYFDTAVVPIINILLVDNINHSLHLINHNPEINWNILDPTGLNIQTQFEIAVGTDDDWAYSEMWNPAPFVSSDTFITYSGSALMDGNTYYLRLRVHNGTAWSDWYNTSFRMNSIPTVPLPIQPINDLFTTATPTLWIDNSTDAEGDPLTYDFFCVVDTTYGEPYPIEGYNIPEATDSTGWQVTIPLEENKRYFWNVRAFDGYEYSEWTDIFSAAFFVNETPEPPAAFQAQFPPDTSNMPVFDMLTNFMWSQSYDPDPFDTVRYKLRIALDSNFTYVNTIDSILFFSYTPIDSFLFGTHYWWKVTAFDKDGLTTQSTNIPDFWTWMLGDVNHDHDVNIADLVYMVNYIFKGGTSIYPEFVGDVDHTCDINVADLVYMVNYLFKGGDDPLVGCD
ncbi:MAG: dockerin type I repeat-containing protein [bacterium]